MGFRGFRSPSLLLIVAIALVCWCGPAAADKRVAFVVGIKDYANVGSLSTPLRDVDTMAATLTAIGFDVTVAKNVDRTGFYTAFEAFKSKISTGDTAFFFYAGHGVGLRGANFLLPRDIPTVDVNSEQLLRSLSIAETDVIEGIREKGARLTIAVLDSCRNNPIEDAARRQAAAAGRSFTRSVSMLSRGLTAPEHISGVLSIYSAGIGQEALDALGPDDQAGNSVFTRVFAQKLKQPGLSLGDLVSVVQDEVSGLALTAKDERGELHPHEQTPASYNETRGGLIYLAGLPKPEETPGPAPSAAADEIVWRFLNKSNLADVRRFPVEFPASSHRREAEALIAALERDEERRKLAAVAPPVQPAMPSSPIQPAAVASPVRPGSPCGGSGALTVSLSSRAAQPLSAAEECALKPKDVFKECDNCPEMVVVPAGSFTMGSPASEEGRVVNEGPQHTVTFAKPFAVGSHSVTVDQFAAFVQETSYDAGSKCWTLEDNKEEERPNRSWRSPGYTQKDGSGSVGCVSWNDAKPYVAWLSRKTGKTYRLLSEAEHEYVTRAGTTGRLWWPKKADSYPPSPWDNPWGVNIRSYEWVEDCYHDSYTGAPSDGAAWIAGDCSQRVRRGGFWMLFYIISSAARLEASPDHRYYLNGFRVARALVGP
jgi:formylglycine-generating enzyme required for sulfatase activity